MGSVRLVAVVEVDVEVPDEMTTGEQQSEARRAAFEMLSQAKSGRRKRKGSAAITPMVVGVNLEQQPSGRVSLPELPASPTATVTFQPAWTAGPDTQIRGVDLSPSAMVDPKSVME